MTKWGLESIFMGKFACNSLLADCSIQDFIKMIHSDEVSLQTAASTMQSDYQGYLV